MDRRPPRLQTTSRLVGDTTDRHGYHTAVAVDDRGHTLFEIKGLPDQAAPAPLSDAPPSLRASNIQRFRIAGGVQQIGLRVIDLKRSE